MAIPGSSNSRGFWNISDDILQQTGIPPKGLEKDTLTALANLRNSYHSNGIHNNDSLSVKINGIMFEFYKGKRVECASWKHIITIIQANISVLESILFSNAVLNIRGEIQDDFAAGNS